MVGRLAARTTNISLVGEGSATFRFYLLLLFSPSLFSPPFPASIAIDTVNVDSLAPVPNTRVRGDAGLQMNALRRMNDYWRTWRWGLDQIWPDSATSMFSELFIFCEMTSTAGPALGLTYLLLAKLCTNSSTIRLNFTGSSTNSAWPSSSNRFN